MLLEQALKELRISRATFYERVDALEQSGAPIRHYIANVGSKIYVGSQALEMLREYGERINSTYLQYRHEMLVAGIKTLGLLALACISYGPLFGLMVSALPAMLIVGITWMSAYRPRKAIRAGLYILLFSSWIATWRLVYVLAEKVAMPGIPEQLVLVATMPVGVVLWIFILMFFGNTATLLISVLRRIRLVVINRLR